jgi:hypothetical protein
MPHSIQRQIEDGLVGIIRGMQLEWPRSEEVVARRLPWNTQGDKTTIFHRGITVFPTPPREAAGTNQRDDIGYGVGLAFISSADQSLENARDQVLASREAIRRKIIYDRLSITLTGGHFIQVKLTEPEVNLPKDAHLYEISIMAIRAWVRESRT